MDEHADTPTFSKIHKHAYIYICVCVCVRVFF